MSDAPRHIAALYGTHGHLVLRRAMRLLGNDQDARDILQQVFVSLVGDPERFRGDSAVATYLYRITTNLCLQHLRNRRTRASLLELRVAPAQRDAADATADKLVAVRELVACLPELLARVVIYHFVDGMTHEEIAEQIGCSRRHVGNLIEDAMDRIHERAAEPPARAEARR